jgi:DNA polymerase-3 subunit chi
MTEVRFYHLTATSLEAALPRLLEKTLERGKRALVMAGSERRVEALAERLWTYDDRGFLPHGTAADGHGPAQPVWLSEQEEAPNAATYLFLTDGATSARIADYELCALLFDGHDAEAVAAARQQWKELAAAGHEVSYWQQDDAGRWQNKAAS